VSAGVGLVYPGDGLDRHSGEGYSSSYAAGVAVCSAGGGDCGCVRIDKPVTPCYINCNVPRRLPQKGELARLFFMTT